MNPLPLRTRLHLNQAKFGLLLGVGQNTVSGWENGKNEPDANNADLLRLLDEHPDPAPLFQRMFAAESAVARAVILVSPR